MQSIFQEQLNEELLRSERKRTIIIILLFSTAILYRYVSSLFFEMDDESKQIQYSTAVWLLPLLVILFEILSLLFLNRRSVTGQKAIPLYLQYLNTGIEVCLPSLIILSVAHQYPQYDILKSPALYIYFLFIILSTLRLNFALSFFCGVMASFSYATFRLSIDGKFTDSDAGRTFIILLSGFAAGLVARQIRAGIDRSLKETEKMNRVTQLLGKQVSREVADQMLESDGLIESRRMKVAVMFVDIRNFTRFVAEHSPEQIVQYQNAFFSIIVNTVSQHHGIVNQFLGDGCMVTFGAPRALVNPSGFAVHAAFELLRKLENQIELNHLPHTRIGIGIHSGEAVTGNIGTQQRQQYSITGNVVVLASRIEQLNKSFNSQFLVSKDVINSLGEEVRMGESLGMVELKGWHEPLELFKLA